MLFSFSRTYLGNTIDTFRSIHIKVSLFLFNIKYNSDSSVYLDDIHLSL